MWSGRWDEWPWCWNLSGWFHPCDEPDSPSSSARHERNIRYGTNKDKHTVSVGCLTWRRCAAQCVRPKDNMSLLVYSNTTRRILKLSHSRGGFGNSTFFYSCPATSQAFVGNTFMSLTADQWVRAVAKLTRDRFGFVNGRKQWYKRKQSHSDVDWRAAGNHCFFVVVLNNTLSTSHQGKQLCSRKKNHLHLLVNVLLL